MKNDEKNYLAKVKLPDRAPGEEKRSMLWLP